MAYKVWYGTCTRVDSMQYNFVNRECIYDQTNPLDDNVLIDPCLIQEANAAGSFEFTIRQDHTHYGQLAINKGYIQITLDEDNRVIWMGRIREVTVDWDNQEVVYCEGDLAVLNDRMIINYGDSTSRWSFVGIDEDDDDSAGYTPQTLIASATYHRSTSYLDLTNLAPQPHYEIDFGYAIGAIESEQFIPSLTYNYVQTKYWKPTDAIYGNSYSFLTGDFLTENGGYIYTVNIPGTETTDDDGNVTYSFYKYFIYICSELDSSNSDDFDLNSEYCYTDQTIEFGKNMLDLEYYMKMSDSFVTTLRGIYSTSTGFWFWKKTSQTYYDYTPTGMSSYVSTYGKVYDTIMFDSTGLTSSKVAERLAIEWKQNYTKNLEIGITINAVDLKDTGVDTDRLSFMKKTRIISTKHGIDGYFLCTKKTTYLDDPSKTEFEFGTTWDSLTKNQATINATFAKSALNSSSLANYLRASN